MLMYEEPLSMPWPERTLTRMQGRILDSAMKEQAAFPKCSLFADGLKPGEAHALWRISYARRDEPLHEMTTDKELERDVLERLIFDVLTLQPGESALLDRLRLEPGPVKLEENSYDPVAAESFGRRLWGYSQRGEDGELYFHMPAGLRRIIVDFTSQPQYDEARSQYLSFLYMVIGTMNITGTLLLDDVEARFRTEIIPMLGHFPLEDERLLFHRLVYTSFDVVTPPGRRTILVHPGLIDPASYEPQTAMMDWEALRGLDNPDILGELLISSAERGAITRMAMQMIGLTRQDHFAPAEVEDLHILIKQGAPKEALREVLASQLICRPTSQMLDALMDLRRMTSPFLFAPKGGLR